MLIYYFLFVLFTGAVMFAIGEYLALRSATDKLYTFSSYVKNWRRRHGTFGAIVVSCAIMIPPLVLFAHLVLEWF